MRSASRYNDKVNRLIVVALFIALQCVACASRAPVGADAATTTAPATPTTTAPATPTTTAPATTTPFAYVDLATGKLATDGAPNGLYVRFADGLALSDVLGDGAIGAQGRPGYLELATGTFMGNEEARAPTKPYVEGAMTAQGFSPSSRRVFR